METKDTRIEDHPAPADTDSRLAEAEQTETAVWESLLELRLA